MESETLKFLSSATKYMPWRIVFLILGYGLAHILYNWFIHQPKRFGKFQPWADLIAIFLAAFIFLEILFRLY